MWIIHRSRNTKEQINPVIASIHIVGGLLFFLAGSALAQMSFANHLQFLPQGPGGIFGSWFVHSTEPYLNGVGAILSYIAMLLVSLTLMIGLVWLKILTKTLSFCLSWFIS